MYCTHSKMLACCPNSLTGFLWISKQIWLFFTLGWANHFQDRRIGLHAAFGRAEEPKLVAICVYSNWSQFNSARMFNTTFFFSRRIPWHKFTFWVLADTRYSQIAPKIDLSCWCRWQFADVSNVGSIAPTTAVEDLLYVRLYFYCYFFCP